MRNKLLHAVVLVGALSNTIILAMMEMPIWLIIVMTAIYVLIFEGLLLLLAPRLVKAERERNVKAYPFLRELIDAKKAMITLRDGTVYYNATFEGYAHKDAKTIMIHVHTVKTKKIPSSVTEYNVKLISIKAVKKMQ